MILTGKCKEEFEKYRLLKHSDTELEIRGSGCSVWESMGNSMIYGVYVDYFDQIKYKGKGLFSQVFEMCYRDKADSFTHNYIVEISIKQCNEMYNEELNK